MASPLQWLIHTLAGRHRLLWTLDCRLRSAGRRQYMKTQYDFYIANPGNSSLVLLTVATSSTGATSHRMVLARSGRPTSPSPSSRLSFGLSAPLWGYGSCANTRRAMALLLVMEFLLVDAGTDVIRLPSQDHRWFER